MKILINTYYRITLAFRIALIVIVTIYCSLRAYIYMRIRKDKSAFFQFATNWSALVLRMFNVKVEEIGYEKIKPDQPYIFASNHSSLFDIPILFTALKCDYVIIYKRELEKIPIFGWILKYSPFIAIDRGDPRNAKASIDTALATLGKKGSLIIFPEGTRSGDGVLGTFKRGAFMLASRSAKPIVPVTVVGSFQIMPARTFRIKGGNIKVIFENPIENKGELSKLEEKEMMDLVRTKIVNNLELYSTKI